MNNYDINLDMKENMLLVSLILFIISLVFFVLSYFMFHYFGKDLKFHKEKKMVPDKPFVTNLVGVFGTMMLASSVIILLLALICY